MNNSSSDVKKRNFFTLLCAFAVIIIVLIIIIYRGLIFGWIQGIVNILNPVIIGFVLAYLCNPLYKWYSNKVLRKIANKKVKKGLSLVLTYFTLIAILCAIATLIIPQIVSSYKELESKFDSYLGSAKQWINDFAKKIPFFNGEYQDLLGVSDLESLASKLVKFISQSGNTIEKILNYTFGYGKTLIEGTANAFIGLFISVYVLIYKERMASFFKRFLRSISSRKAYDTAIHKISTCNTIFGNFCIGRLIDAFIVTIVCLVVFTIFGIPFSPLVSVFVGIMNLIPMIGPFIGAIPSIFIIFIVSPTKAILFVVLLIVIQQIDANIIDPFISGSRIGLTALEVIIAVTIMGGAFGIPGLLLGVPLFAVLTEVIHEMIDERLEKIDDPEFPPIDRFSETEQKKTDIFSRAILSIKNKLKK